MLYQWQFRLYQRRFKQALQTHHGLWNVRKGIILRLVDAAGNVGWGEVAPIPWFGSETVEQALDFCYQLPSELTDNHIFSISDALPSCQFAFEAAWEGMRAQAIDNIEPQRRRDAECEALLVNENSTLQPQNSVIAVPSSVIAAQNSTFRDQSSELRPQNSTLRPQNSTLRPQSSELRPQNSVIAVPSSVIAAQNSELRPQNSDIAAQNSKPDVHPTPPHSSPLTPHSSLTHSALLPAGETALHAWKPLWEKGFRTFKWKIGVHAIASELAILHRLTQHLPQSAKLRLDANGGLSLDDAVQWLERCDTITANSNASGTIEYIEQPLPIAQFEAMRNLSHRYKTAIALDESVATLQQLQACYEEGWTGVFVIKPAIVGSPSRLRQFCQEHPIDAVFSSAFETVIGRQAGLKLAATLGNSDRAVGYGTAHWFEDAEISDFEQLWQTL